MLEFIFVIRDVSLIDIVVFQIYYSDTFILLGMKPHNYILTVTSTTNVLFKRDIKMKQYFSWRTSFLNIQYHEDATGATTSIMLWQLKACIMSMGSVSQTISLSKLEVE